MSKKINENMLNADQLQGNMGVGALVMSVLAFSGPLLTVSAFIALYYSLLGPEAAGVPVVYIYVTLVLFFFAIGFSKMGTVMQRPGGFYTYVTEGLGRNCGLMTAVLAIGGYVFIGLFAPPCIALYAQNAIENIFHGPHIHWYIIAIISVAITTFFAYRKIDLSAAVLFWVMVFESVAIFIFDGVCFTHGGGFEPVLVPSIATDGFGIVLLFAVGNFFGFEATVIYREECRNPQKTIPRATFIAVIGIGLFYFLAAWAFLSFYGADKVAGALSENAATSFMDILATLNKGFADVISCLIVTSLLASQLSIQNVATRYLYSLGKDHVFPSFLGKVHKKHYSPYMAATTVGVIWAIVLTVFLPTGKGPDYLYPLFAGVGEFFLVMIVFLASLAVIAYFRKNKQFNFSLGTTLIAPILGAIGVAFVLIKAVLNFTVLTNAPGIVSVVIFTAIILIAIGGYAYAKYLQKAKPEIYGRIGRQDFVDIDG